MNIEKLEEDPMLFQVRNNIDFKPHSADKDGNVIDGWTFSFNPGVNRMDIYRQ